MATDTTTTDVTAISQGWIFSQTNIEKVSIAANKLTTIKSYIFPESMYNVIMDGNKTMYVSGMSYLYKMTIGNYPETGSFYFYEDAKKFNPNQDIILACGNNLLLSAQTYVGNVATRNKETLDQVKLFSNIDSPIKAKWSSYHNAFIVVGKNGIWKVSETADLVFSVDGYLLKDMAVNTSGQIAIVLSSEIDNKDVIKVLHNDFYKNVISSYYDYDSIKSIVLAGNLFYAIQELPSTEGIYNGIGLLIDPKNKAIDSISIQAVVQKEASDKPQTTTQTIQVTFPTLTDTLALNKEYDIAWISSKGATDKVSIELQRAGVTKLVIIDRTDNSGNYKWKVPSNIELSSEYTIKITWLTSTVSSSNSGISDKFIISDTEPPPDQADGADYISGISYDVFSNSIILSFYSGKIGVHNLTLRQFYGLFVSDLGSVNGNVANNDQIKQFNDTSKVRLFVGSEKYLNDKWDSGIVETDLTSIYYGGGNNLRNGGKYYVHIQVYSPTYGWSEVQIKEFTMPL